MTPGVDQALCNTLFHVLSKDTEESDITIVLRPQASELISPGIPESSFRVVKVVTTRCQGSVVHFEESTL